NNKQDIGFLGTIEGVQRANVATSRAKEKLIMVGDFSKTLGRPNSVYLKIADIVRNKGWYEKKQVQMNSGSTYASMLFFIPSTIGLEIFDLKSFCLRVGLAIAVYFILKYLKDKAQRNPVNQPFNTYPLTIPETIVVQAKEDSRFKEDIVIPVDNFEVPSRGGSVSQRVMLATSIRHALNIDRRGESPRAPPSLKWQIVITINPSLLSINGPIYVATVDIQNKTVYMHPYFFSLPQYWQDRIMYHELVSHLIKNINVEALAIQDTQVHFRSRGQMFLEEMQKNSRIAELVNTLPSQIRQQFSRVHLRGVIRDFSGDHLINIAQDYDLQRPFSSDHSQYTVMEVTDKVTFQRYVIKMFKVDDLLAEVFLIREALLLEGMLNREKPAMKIHDIGLWGNKFCIVLDYEGDSLMSLLACRRCLSFDEAMDFIKGSLRALHNVHQDLLLLDIKPENICFRRDRKGYDFRHPRFIDAGLACPIIKSGTHSGLSLEGTPFYAAPELAIFNRGIYLPVVDLHSLGVTLYYSMTGSYPFPSTGDTVSILYHKVHTQYDFEDLEGILSRDDPRYRLIVALCDKDPSRRPPSAAVALKQYFNEDVNDIGDTFDNEQEDMDNRVSVVEWKDKDSIAAMGSATEDPTRTKGPVTEQARLEIRWIRDQFVFQSFPLVDHHEFEGLRREALQLKAVQKDWALKKVLEGNIIVRGPPEELRQVIDQLEEKYQHSFKVLGMNFPSRSHDSFAQMILFDPTLETLIHEARALAYPRSSDIKNERFTRLAVKSLDKASVEREDLSGKLKRFDEKYASLSVFEKLDLARKQQKWDLIALVIARQEKEGYGDAG
ncbi:MAG: hypothetical protein HQL15_10915, partial [Candidatus Omnitrophica bacterium]|nr:hypothetical protein [Candidatus Omnitrophota bacterium]